jgi:Ca2+-binding RTX toxin-like protein
MKSITVTVDAAPPTTTCGGETATIVGTPRNDNNIVGTSGRDVIAALGGNDRICTLAGDDLICAGSVNDQLNGGAGNDDLDVGNNRETSGYRPDFDRSGRVEGVTDC